MEILFNYEQEKAVRNKPLTNLCKLKLASDDDTLLFTSEYYIQYFRFGKVNYLSYEHGLSINKKNGDISTIYQLLNNKENTTIRETNVMKAKKNSFEMLMELTNRGFYNGEKQFSFWGVRYQRACGTIFQLIAKDLGMDLTQRDKAWEVNPLYDIIVDYHLNKKGIKGHDSVYWDICEAYPKPRSLKANDYKFLPAILDDYKIKTRYLVGTLSSRKPTLERVRLKSVKFLCNLFGDNYIDYIRDFDWETICMERMYKSTNYTCEDESEKKAIAKSLKSYTEVDGLLQSGVLTTIQELFGLKEFLKENNMIVKIKGNSCHHLNSLKDNWELHKKHFKLGYKLKYTLPDEMVNDLQEPIIFNGKTFKPTLILTEDHFKLEGMIMKNCMANQFAVGNLYVHASISLDRKRINVQYRKGVLNQNRGKANSTSPKEFNDAVDIFTKKMEKYSSVVPIKEKYDIINPYKSES